jgi:diguanylate cyclase (GGDEF)-like protein
MEDFGRVLYEAVLVSFGKVLAKYNVFAQGYVLRDVGKEIVDYLKRQGLDFEETGDLEDLDNIIQKFVQNGFAENLQVKPADVGQMYIWKGIYGYNAYRELFDLTENPFLSCPLNLCLYYLADKNHQRMHLIKKTFDDETQTTVSQYEIVDQDALPAIREDPLVVEVARLYDVVRRREELYRQQALTDSLTEMYNRRYLLDEGNRLILQSQRSKQPFSVLMIDIDRFKTINDTYGHVTGDVALCIVASLCRQSVRQTDVLGRFGGEEFVALLPNTALNRAHDLAERLRRGIASSRIQANNGDCFSLTVSIGAASFDQTVVDFEHLLSRADEALFAAKNAGRNQVCLFGQ